MALRQSSKSLQRLARLACASKPIFPDACLCPTGTISKNTFTSISSGSQSQILSHSSVFLQDGHDIKELPVVVRKINESEVFTSLTNTGQERREHVTDQDDLFKQELRNCQTVWQVLKLMEVPKDTVTQLAASFALERLAQLQDGITRQVDTFIRKAVFKELCDTATENISAVTCDRLVSLVKCYLKANNFPENHVERINIEVEKRVGDGVFTIAQLSTLTKLLSEHVKGDQDVANNVWIHLAARYQEIDENNIRTVFAAIRNISNKQKYICALLAKQICKFWWKLQPADISEICKAITSVNFRSEPLLKLMSKWFFVNMHQVSDNEITDILIMCNYFKFGDKYMSSALTKYVPCKIKNMNKKAVALVTDYLCEHRYFSPCILDAVAEDFEHNHVKYGSPQMYHALKVFGYLNYLPPNAARLFGEIDKVLHKRFSDFQAHQILEMLASFTYLGRFPTNFINRIFTPHFLARVQGVESKLVKDQAVEHLRHLYCAIKLEMNGKLPAFISDDLLLGYRHFLRGQWMMFHRGLGESLHHYVDPQLTREFENPKGTPYFIDYELAVDTKGQIIAVSKTGLSARKVALLTVMPEHTCVNSGHLLGQFAMRRRHLQFLGFTTVEVDYDHFMKMDRRKRNEYIAELVQKICAPTKPSDAPPSIFNSLVGKY